MPPRPHVSVQGGHKGDDYGRLNLLESGRLSTYHLDRTSENTLAFAMQGTLYGRLNFIFQKLTIKFSEAWRRSVANPVHPFPFHVSLV